MAFPRTRTGRPPSVVLVVEEVLGSVLSPARVGLVLREATAAAGLQEVPAQPAALRVFVEGALFAALTEHLDVADALEILQHIRGALAHAFPPNELSSDIRMRQGAELSPRTVLVATAASLVVFLLQDMLGEEVDILPVSSEGQLADRLRRATGPLLLLVDRQHAALGDLRHHLSSLPAGSAVIWWGGSTAEQRGVEGALGGHVELVPTPEDLRLADLGELCRRLVG